MNSAADLRLRDIATQDVLTVTPKVVLQQAVRLFAECHVSSLVVVDAGKPVGILTERDLLRALCCGLQGGVEVGVVMSAPLKTARMDMDFASAQALLANHGIRHLVLVDETGGLQGVVSETDFRRHISHDLFEAIQSLAAVMDASADSMSTKTTLKQAADTMLARRLDHVLVCDQDGKAVGILTERDIPRLMNGGADPSMLTLEATMASPLISIGLGVSVAEAARLMETHRIRHLAVLDEAQRPIGTISQHRLLERLGVVLLEEGRNWLFAQLDMVLESTGVGTWEYDHRQAVLRCSTALSRVLHFGGAGDSLSLSDLLLRVFPEDRTVVGDAFRQKLCGPKGSFSIEYRLAEGQGGGRWVSSRGQVVERGYRGQPIRSAGVIIDVDEQVSREHRLKLSEAHFRTLMAEVPLPLCQVGKDGRLNFINRHFISTFGYTLSDVPDLDTWWRCAYPDPAYRATVVSTWEAALVEAQREKQSIRPGEYKVCCQDGNYRIVEISGVLLEPGFLATFVDVTERRREQQLLQFNNDILQLMSMGACMTTVLDEICKAIEARVPQTRCSVLLLDATGQRFVNGAAPSMSSEFCRLIEGLTIGPDVGTCGTAAYRQQPVFSGDLRTDPLWANFRKLADDNQLGACWSSPVWSEQGELQGTFAVYWSLPQTEIDPLLKTYVTAATALVSIAVDKDKRAALLRRSLEALQRAEAIGRMGGWSWDRNTEKVWWSDQMFELFALDARGETPDLEHFLRGVHPEDRDLVRQTYQGFLEGRGTGPLRFRRSPALGAMKVLEASSSPRYDAQGGLEGFDGVLRDITEEESNRKKLEEQLQELRRWQTVMLGREDRVLELKEEVNTLLARLGEAPRYGASGHD